MKFRKTLDNSLAWYYTTFLDLNHPMRSIIRTPFTTLVDFRVKTRIIKSVKINFNYPRKNTRMKGLP